MSTNQALSALSMTHVETEHGGVTYSADFDPQTGVVAIYRGTELAGEGRWDGSSITDCAAELVQGNADATEDVYDALDQELAAATGVVSLTLRQLLPGGESSPDQICDSVQCLDRETAAAWIDEHATAVYCGWELTHPDGRTEHCYTGTGHPRVWIPGPVS